MFSFEEIDNLDSYDEKINYANGHLEIISNETGDTRVCFLLNEDKILKLAKDEEGLISNNVEKYYSDTKWSKLVEVFDYDQDFFWIVCERSEPIDEERFEKITGIDIDKFYQNLYVNRIWKFMSGATGIQEQKESDTEFDGFLRESRLNGISKEILEKSEELGFDTSDIPIIENLGLLKRGGKEEIVIRNYGMFDRRFRKFS
jgi:hypothetical protein